MVRNYAVLIWLLSGALAPAETKGPVSRVYSYDVAREHELKPHRRNIPVKGAEGSFNQLRVTLVVSPTGEVTDAKASGDEQVLKFWPQLRNEVRQWKFVPFEKDGKALTAEVEEYIDLVPPERFPTNHVAAPVIRADSKIGITLERGACYGTCPIYKVTVSTEGITFEGQRFVVAQGKQTGQADAAEVRKLAKRFVDADFYSMDENYVARVTDNPTYILTVAIDGRVKQVRDYVGSWVGMPAVITELENEVDEFAGTRRWIGKR